MTSSGKRLRNNPQSGTILCPAMVHTDINGVMSIDSDEVGKSKEFRLYLEDFHRYAFEDFMRLHLEDDT